MNSRMNATLLLAVCLGVLAFEACKAEEPGPA